MIINNQMYAILFDRISMISMTGYRDTFIKTKSN